MLGALGSWNSWICHHKLLAYRIHFFENIHGNVNTHLYYENHTFRLTKNVNKQTFLRQNSLQTSSDYNLQCDARISSWHICTRHYVCCAKEKEVWKSLFLNKHFRCYYYRAGISKNHKITTQTRKRSREEYFFVLFLFLCDKYYSDIV